MDYKNSTRSDAVIVAERRKMAFDLRKSGLGYAEIADQITATMGADVLPASWNGWFAHQDVQYILDKMREEVAENAIEVIAIENARLDTMLSALWPAVLSGNTASINTALKIMERRAKMLGLDEARKVDWKVEVGGMIAAGLITREEVRLELGDELYNLVTRYLAEEAEGDIGQEDLLVTKIRGTTSAQHNQRLAELKPGFLEAPKTIEGEIADD